MPYFFSGILDPVITDAERKGLETKRHSYNKYKLNEKANVQIKKIKSNERLNVLNMAEK